MDRWWDAEDEGFKALETPVLATWRQRCTAFNAPWETDSGLTSAMWCLFQHRCSSASEFAHFIPVITSWIVSPEHHSLWLHLFGTICPWSQNSSARGWCSRSLLHWFLQWEAMSPSLMDTLSRLMMEENKRTFCCLHSSGCFESVEQLTRDWLCSEWVDWWGLAAEGICFLS